MSTRGGIDVEAIAREVAPPRSCAGCGGQATTRQITFDDALRGLAWLRAPARA